MRILMVCHGNICRSPMAEAILREKLRLDGMEHMIFVESAAVSREEIGNDIYPPAKRILQLHHIPFARRAARQMTMADYRDFDLLFGMDASNLRRMKAICGGDPAGKLRLLTSCLGENGEIADPWYTDDFETTYMQISACCDALIRQLKKEQTGNGV